MDIQPKDKNYISVGGWLLMTLLLGIPLVNIIMLIIWAADSENLTRRNFAIAAFIWMLIGVVLAVLIVALMGLAFLGLSFAQPS